MATTYSPSAALVRTARTEIARVERTLSAIERRRVALAAELAELDAEAEGYRRRRALLEDLVEVERATPTVQAGADIVTASTRAVKGRTLREVATRLLWSWQDAEEIHYREWFERVLSAGYAVAGKDPAASFLTNVRDSPAVVRGSRQGYYRLDPSSVARLEQTRRELEAELADVQQSLERSYEKEAPTGSAPALREHRDRLRQQIKRLDADLCELRQVFEEDPRENDPPSAAAPSLRVA